MVTETPNLKLKKPDGTDLVDVSVLNGNMDKIDEAVGNISVDVVQSASGISVGGTALQDATASQDGLMTKELVTAIGGKVDKSGGAMTGYLTDPYTGQVRNITQSDRAPTSADGKDGDVWIGPGEEPVKSVENAIGGTPEAPTLTTTVNGVTGAPVNLPAGGGSKAIEITGETPNEKFANLARYDFKIGDRIVARTFKTSTINFGVGSGSGFSATIATIKKTQYSNTYGLTNIPVYSSAGDYVPVYGQMVESLTSDNHSLTLKGITVENGAWSQRQVSYQGLYNTIERLDDLYIVPA